jgi:hypothetical protein
LRFAIELVNIFFWFLSVPVGEIANADFFFLCPLVTMQPDTYFSDSNQSSNLSSATWCRSPPVDAWRVLFYLVSSKRDNVVVTFADGTTWNFTHDSSRDKPYRVGISGNVRGRRFEAPNDVWSWIEETGRLPSKTIETIVMRRWSSSEETVYIRGACPSLKHATLLAILRAEKDPRLFLAKTPDATMDVPLVEFQPEYMRVMRELPGAPGVVFARLKSRYLAPGRIVAFQEAWLGRHY